MLSDEEIASAECLHLSAHAQFVGAGEVWIEGASDFVRAIESAATAPLLERIAELERQFEEAKKDANNFHKVMGCLSDMRLPHGTCMPRSRMACTNCNAFDALRKLTAEYRGPMVVAQAAPSAT